MNTAAAAVNETTGEDLGAVGNPLARKIADVMREVSHVAKSGRNDFHKYDYTKEADVYDVVRQKFAERNVVIIPRALPESFTVTPGLGKSNDEIVTSLLVEFTLIDGDSGVREVGCFPGAGSDKLDKGCYKAMTGAEKYFVQKLLLLSQGHDPEKLEPQQGSAPAQRQAPPANGPRPLAAPQPAARPVQAAATASPAPGASSGPRPLGRAPQAAPAAPAPNVAAAMDDVARQMAAIAADPNAVGLQQVYERIRGKHPQHGEYVLWTVLTDAGQKLSAMDDKKGNIGTGLKAACDAGQRVVLTVEQYEQGPKITAFRISGAAIAASQVKW
jgi:hypothetical protein